MKSLVTCFVVLASVSAPLLADNIVYSSLPSGTYYNVPSEAFEETSTAEFGQGVSIGTSTGLAAAQILMSDWALESTYEGVGLTTGFDVPLTLTLYTVGSSNSVGAVIWSGTIDAHILWRPEDNPGCSGSAWMAPDGNCYHGLAQIVTFNMGGVAVPSEFIWGLSFNTTNYGASPTHVPGPYDSLNVGTSGGASIGSDLVVASAFLNSGWAGAYGDLGAGGTGTFRLDPIGWAGYDPAAEFDAVPEPGSFGMMIGAALTLGLVFVRRRRQSPQR